MKQFYERSLALPIAKVYFDHVFQRTASKLSLTDRN